MLFAFKWQIAIVYLEDIVVFSRPAAEQIYHVKYVLELLWDAVVDLKLKKCNFFTETIDFLGHVICPRCSEIASHMTDAVKRLKAPWNVTKLKSFLGLCIVLRRLVPNLATLSSPLNEKVRKDQPFNFEVNEKELEAMKSL